MNKSDGLKEAWGSYGKSNAFAISSVWFVSVSLHPLKSSLTPKCFVYRYFSDSLQHWLFQKTETYPEAEHLVCHILPFKFKNGSELTGCRFILEYGLKFKEIHKTAVSAVLNNTFTYWMNCL